MIGDFWFIDLGADVHRRQFFRCRSAFGALALQTSSAGAVPGLESGNLRVSRPAKPFPVWTSAWKRTLIQKHSRPMPEVQKGKDIVASARCAKSLNVAQFFADLRQGELNNGLGAMRIFMARSGPCAPIRFIVSFFDATTLRRPPAIKRPGRGFCQLVHRTKPARAVGRPEASRAYASAASKPSGTWGQKTEAPRPGDIVVFQHKRKPGGPCRLFCQPGGHGIYVLGGNQMPARAKLPDGTYERRNTERSMSPHARLGADLISTSFARDPSLHIISTARQCRCPAMRPGCASLCATRAPGPT